MISRSSLPDAIEALEGYMPPKILIVDDEASIRTLLKRTLVDLEDDKLNFNPKN